jgi:hypothetical protein
MKFMVIIGPEMDRFSVGEFISGKFGSRPRLRWLKISDDKGIQGILRQRG